MTSADDRANIAITGEYIAAQKLFSVGLSFDEFRPSAFSDLGQPLRVLDAIDLPIRGTVGLAFGGDAIVKDVTFDLIGGVGHFVLPVWLAKDLDMLSAAQRLAVRGFGLHGAYRTAGSTVEIDNLNIDLAPGQSVYLPAPIDHPMPLAAVRGRGTYSGDTKRVAVDSLEVNLDGPVINAKATADGVGEAITAKAEVTATGIKTVDLKRYWPPSLASGGREWSVESLSDGGITNAKLEVTLDEGPDGIDVSSLTGTMNIEGVTVDYLQPMPKARDVSGVATFDTKSMTFKNVSGNVEGVSVTDGTVVLADFDKPIESASFDLPVRASIPAALTLINHQPLGYASLMGIDPEKTGGNSTGRIRMKFPLLSTLTFDQIDLSGDFKLENVSIAKIAFDKDITDGTLNVALDTKGMDVDGRLKFGGLEASVKWRENFDSKNPINRRVALVMDNAKTSVLRDLQLGMAPIIQDITEGPLNIDLQMVSFNDGKSDIQIVSTADNAMVRAPYLGWTKSVGQPASAKIKLHLIKGNTISDISSFDLRGPGLKIEGSARFDPKGQLASVNLNEVKVGKTDIKGTLNALPTDGWNVDVSGNSVDLQPLIKAVESADDGSEADDGIQQNVSVKANLGTVWLNAEQPLTDVSGVAVREKDIWKKIWVDGRVGAGAQVKIRIDPREDNKRTLYIHSPNAGDTLLGLGITKNLIGGTLDINGTFDDSDPGHPLTGRAEITNYRIANAPAMAKLLSIMALTGILDSLRGRGIAFSILEVPFTMRDDVFELQNARASGTELGLTASGRISGDKLDIRGTVVPFFAVNSLLGKIPVIGGLFSGGEKGGGLLAANYAMVGPIDDPQVTINPLSMLTPGIFRNLFHIFDGTTSSTGKAVPKEPAPNHP
jgi:hypothetical protein